MSYAEREQARYEVSTLSFKHYLIYFFQVDVVADMIGEAIVLLFFERHIIEGARILTNLLGIRTKQEVDEGSIVEDAMDVGAHAFVAHDVTIGTAVGEVEQW